MRAHDHRPFRLRHVTLAVLALLGAPQAGHALPQGAQVVSGQLTVGTPAGGRLGLVQSSGRAIVDWRSFGIGASEAVTLAQPGGGVALFRVTGGEASSILGNLSATGTLFLSNPAGVYVGAGGRADVGSVVATTLGISNTDFLAGRHAFSGDSRASVVNDGHLQAGTGGSVVLLGAHVANRGTIDAPQGSVALGAGSAATLDVYGNGLLKLNLTAGAAGARVDHGGTITADGGVAGASALGAGAVLNVGGLIRAQSLEQRDGAIYLTGGAGSQINLGGTLDASGTGNGGRIDVRADRIDVAATGVLRADAGAMGHGGTIDAIATDAMRFDGHVSARGGAAGGDGGNAEISGHATLAMDGSADLRAAAGRFGTLLLDPGSFTILRSNGNANNSNQISDTALTTLLGTGNVTLRTATATNNAAETITVDANANVTWSSNATLTLLAGRNIVVNAGAVFSSTSTTSARDAIVMTAGGTSATAATFSGISIGAATLRSSGGAIRLTGTGGNSGASNTGLILTGATVAGNRGGVALTGTGGTGTGGQNAGVWLQGTTSVTTANNGLLAIDGTGVGSGGTSTLNIGVAVPVGSNVTLQSNGGAVSLTGRGGLGSSSYGIFFAGTVNASASTRLSLAGAAGGANDGIQIGTGTTLAGVNGGNVQLTADQMALSGTQVSTTGTATLTTQTAGRAISVGGADTGTTLGLSASDLAGFAPSGTLQIGTSTGGNVSVDAAFAPAAGTGTLQLLSGGTVDVKAAVTGGSTRLNLSGTSGVRLGAALASNAANVASTRAITIRTPGTFTNAADAAALSTPNGSWAVSLATPVGQGFNGLLSGNTAVWSNPVTSNVNPIGNRYSFALAPTVFIDAGSATKVYGDALPATVALNNAPAASIANTFGGVFTDYASATLGGSYTRSSAGLAATANASSYTDLSVTNVAGVTTSLVGYTVAAGATGTVTVSPRSVTLTPATQSRVYGDANPTIGAATGLVNGDTAQLTLSSPATATSAVGSYDLSGASAVFLTGLASNYVIGYGTTAGGLTVTQRPITLTPDAQSRVYGDANPAHGTAAVTTGSLVGTDALADVALASAATAGSVVGTYNLSATNAAFASGSAANYDISFADRANGLTVTQRPVTLTLQGSASRPYGGGVTNVRFAAPTVTGGSLAAGDRIFGYSASFAGPALTAPVGTYGGTFLSASLVNGAGQGVTANYAITRVDAPFFVTQRPLTLTPVAVSRTYGDANPTTAGATSNSGTGVGLVNGDTVSQLSIASPADATSNVGSHASTGSSAVFATGSASNYAISYGTNSAGLVVTQRPLTITPDAVSRVYGDANPATAAATGNNLVNGDTIGTVTLGSSATAASNVGTYATSGSNAVFATGLASNYAITYADNASGLQVTQRPVTLTPQGGLSRPYGGGLFSFGGTMAITSGNLAAGDRVTGFAADVSVVGNTAPVGAYPVPVTSANISSGGGTNVGANYAMTFDPITLNVTPRPVTLTPVSLSRLYGDANPAAAGVTSDSGFGVGLVNGDRVSQVALSSPATATSDVGSYASLGSGAVFASGTASNYAITYAANAAGLQVTQRPLTITPGVASRAYGDPNPATAAAIGNNLVNGDTLGTLTLATAATPASSVGSYSTSGGNATFAAGLASNYAISYADNAAGLAITPRALIVTPVAASRTYGDVNPATAAATGNNLVNGDSLGIVTLSTPATAASNVGTYATSGNNATFTTGLASNYTIAYADNAAGLAITPRALIVTPVAASRTYGDVNPATAAATGNNLVNGDSLGIVTLSTPATAASNVGTYATSGNNATFTTGLASNYTIAYADNAAGLAITPRALIVTPAAASRTYGDVNPATAGATGNNLVNGDSLAGLALATPATPASNVGSYATSGSNATFATGLASNYTIAYADNAAGLKITPRPLTVTPDAVTRGYGDANPASGAASASNLVNGDSVASVALTSPATERSGIGSYGLTASNVQFGSGSAANYTIAYQANANGLQVLPRAVAVTASDGQFKFTGQPDPALSFSLTGGTLVAGDTFTGSLVRAAGEVPGGYPIGRGSLDLGPNYTMAFNGAPFTITAAGAIATIDRTPAIAAPSQAGAAFAALIASLPPTAAGNAGTECVREAVLDPAQTGASRIVNRGIRLPEGVVDACR